MQILTVSIGRVLAVREVEASFQDTAAYAAAIGAERDCYLDDRTAGGALAPPCFITSLEWPLVGGPETLAALGVPSESLYGRLLHAFQDSRFERCIRAGERLRLEAVLASVRPAGSGVLAVLRLRTHAAAGELVAQSWFGAFFRNATATAPGAAFDAPSAAIEAPGPAETLGAFAISRGRSHVYGACARLWNPIHAERRFAASAGLPDIALHGTLLWATAGEMFVDSRLGGDPSRLRRLCSRFRRPMHPSPHFVVHSARSAAVPGHATLDVSDGGTLVIQGIAEASGPLGSDH